MLRAWLLAAFVGVAPAAAAQSLSYDAALLRAEQGPLVRARTAALTAAQREIGPASALPDPQLVLGLENVPVTGPDRLRLQRDDMTMQRIAVMQEMPSFAELGARRSIANAEAERARAGLELGRLQARLGAAQAWIGSYYAQRRVAVLERLEREARALSESNRSRLSSGAGGVGDLIAAEVEAARIQDRQAEAVASAAAMRAELGRWTGEAADIALADEAPAFDIDAQILQERLGRHPALVAAEAETNLADAELRMAEAERWPDWSWELSYGRRQPELEDMASVEVRIGLPLFQPWRQGPRVQSRRADVERTEAEREAMTREYASTLQAGLARYEALTASAQRARDVRAPLARQGAEAAAGSFAAGALSAGELIAARREALEAELYLIDLEEQRALLGAALHLQFAETAP